MTWEQIVILVWILVGMFTAISRTVNIPKIKASQVALFVVLDIVLKAAVALVLHMGGFW